MEINLSAEQKRAASEITRCYHELSQKNSNVVWELMQTTDVAEHWQHFPKGDVKDSVNCTQYFYHAHPSCDQDRVPEHGHFHLFFQPGIIPAPIKPMVTSQAYEDSQGKNDNLCHVIAIAMNEQGMPASLFTVNHWVTMGVWYSAEPIIQALDRFIVRHVSSRYALTDLWVTNMVALFRDVIAELLQRRDEVVADQKIAYPDRDVFYDKTLEVTSVCPL